LNEGHTSFVALALAAEYLHDHPEENGISRALHAVSPRIVATKHTILPGAGIYFGKQEFKERIEHYFTRHRIDFDEFFSWGTDESDPDSFSATRFLLKVAHGTNAVSKTNALFEKKRHPESRLIPVTNGIYFPRWQSPLWHIKPVQEMSDAEVWDIHQKLREAMLAVLHKSYGITLDPYALTVVWARRFAPYKRPEALFADLDVLGRLVSNTDKPVQFIISGTGREAGREGERMMHAVKELVSDSRLGGKAVYIPDYSMSLAKLFVTGADGWLNTPVRGMEACGTSGMKASLNGVLQCSAKDGWVEEVDWSGIGWTLPDENISSAIYTVIAEEMAPLFYARNQEGLPKEWIARMRKTIQIIQGNFSAARMIEDYTRELYVPR
jgi:alpha-glucan phosphorylase-like protein